MQQYAGCEQNKIHTFLYSHMVLSDTWNEKKGAVPGLTILMVSTTGENYSYYELDNELIPKKKKLPANLKSSVELIKENFIIRNIK